VLVLARACNQNKTRKKAHAHGWEYSVTSVGRAQRLADAPCDGVWGAQRRMLALTELRVPFSVGLDELHDVDRGARDIDLGSLDEAARRLVTADGIDGPYAASGCA
jgi:uncharacterized linocin/CFP29 family protein